MLKKYKKTAVVLAAVQLKEIKGGTGEEETSFAQPCWEDEDCYGQCVPGKIRGNFCASGICRLFYC